MKHTQKGFTVIEVLVGVFVLTLMISAAGIFQKDIFTVNTFIQTSLLAQQEGRKALKSISAELRAASPSTLGAYPITSAGTSTLIFYANIDSDVYKERLRYFLDGSGNFHKGVIKPSGSPLTYNPANETLTTVMTGIRSSTTPVFSYYDKNYAGTSSPLSQPIDPLAIRLVKVTFIVDHVPNKSPAPLILTTQVSIRNVKDNL